MPNNPQSPRVVLLALDEGSLTRELAQALAARGDSVILWDPHAAPGPIPRPILDLQLALERAGGISLYLAGAVLADAAEAFGHIDAAIAETPAVSRQIAEAAGRLERRLRPARLIVMKDEKKEAPRPGAPMPAGPPGMRAIEAPFAANAPDALISMLALLN